MCHVLVSTAAIAVKGGRKLPHTQVDRPLVPCASMTIRAAMVLATLDRIAAQLFEEIRHPGVAAVVSQFPRPRQIEGFGIAACAARTADDKPIDSVEVHGGGGNPLPQRFG